MPGIRVGLDRYRVGTMGYGGLEEAIRGGDAIADNSVIMRIEAALSSIHAKKSPPGGIGATDRALRASTPSYVGEARTVRLASSPSSKPSTTPPAHTDTSCPGHPSGSATRTGR